MHKINLSYQLCNICVKLIDVNWRINNSIVTKPRLEFENLTKSCQLSVRSYPNYILIRSDRLKYDSANTKSSYPYYIIILSVSYYHLINNIRSISELVIHLLSSVFGLYWIMSSILFGQTQHVVKLLLGSCWNELGILWDPAFNA